MTALRTLAVAAALVAAAAAVPAFAQEATPDTWLQQGHSNKSRADVRAELAAARADGQLLSFSAGYIEQVNSSQPRAEVQANTLKAIARGEVAAINRKA